MINYVISAWSVMWPVHGSCVIIAWSATWAVHDQPRDWSCTDHVADHALLTWLIMHWSSDWSCADHVWCHTLIMCLLASQGESQFMPIFLIFLLVTPVLCWFFKVLRFRWSAYIWYLNFYMCFLSLIETVAYWENPSFGKWIYPLVYDLGLLRFSEPLFLYL